MNAVPSAQEYMAFEAGIMNADQEAGFFQRLRDSGELATLGTRYQSRAQELIAEGVLDDN